MPRYTFRCGKCGKVSTYEHGFDEPHPTRCVELVEVEPWVKDTKEGPYSALCGGELQRVFDVPNVTYHGSGFYSTDKALYDKGDDE